MNISNKKIWDDIFGQLPPISDEVMCENENGNYVPAVPIGYDPEQKTFDALRDIIDLAIKNKAYKTWKCRTKLVETYSDDHQPIDEFDVIYIFTSDWEVPRWPVLVKEIKDDSIVVMWLGGKDDETVQTQEIKYEKC